MNPHLPRRPGRAPVLLAALGLLLPLAACRPPGNPAPTNERARRVPSVGVVTVQPRLIVDRIRLPGNVQAVQTVRLAAEVGGKVQWIGAAEGNRIEKGAEVVRLNAAAKAASLMLAAAQVKLAERELERAEKLYKQGNISPAEYDKLVAERSIAQARHDLARAELDQATITSTVSGYVNRVPIEVGEYVNAGDLVAEILVLRQVEVVVDVPEKDVADIGPDTEVWVAFDFLAAGNPGAPPDAPKAQPALPREILETPGLLKRGKITFIAFGADPVTRTFQVKILLDNENRALRPGMIPRVYFIKRRFPEAVVVPLFAVLPRPGGKHTVFVETGGTARERSIRLGIVQERWVQVLDGVSPGERVVTAGQGSLEDGDQVIVAILDDRRVRP
jgi:membrane fusion protein (multidrug efflux system)